MEESVSGGPIDEEGSSDHLIGGDGSHLVAGVLVAFLEVGSDLVPESGVHAFGAVVAADEIIMGTKLDGVSGDSPSGEAGEFSFFIGGVFQDLDSNGAVVDVPHQG